MIPNVSRTLNVEQEIAKIKTPCLIFQLVLTAAMTLFQIVLLMSHCLKTGSAMMRLTILTVTLMAESAVSNQKVSLVTATTNGAFNKALISLSTQSVSLLQTMVILATIPRSSMAQLRGEYLGKIIPMITTSGAISSEEHMIVIPWDTVKDIVCSGHHAVMIMYGIGLTARMVIGTMQH